MSEMRMYVGTKIIHAVPMTRRGYNEYRGWELPADENGGDTGYLVEYMDGGRANHPAHSGYISWSPTDVFNNSYQPTTRMNFGHAIEMMKQGNRVARVGWNGTGMFIVLMPALHLPPFNTQEPGPKVNDRTARFIGEDTPLDCQPYFAMFTAQKKWQPGWLASQSDMLAEDWYIV